VLSYKLIQEYIEAAMLIISLTLKQSAGVKKFSYNKSKAKL
jgi:hypothetical protein